VGQRVLAADEFRNEVFAKVLALPHSPSAESFVKITMAPTLGSKASKHGLLATLHHTFPRCGGDQAVKALDLKPGDCLHTVEGKGVVQSAEPVPVTEGDVTYTIEIEDAGLVAVGGVFTHAKMLMAQSHLIHVHSARHALAIAKKPHNGLKCRKFHTNLKVSVAATLLAPLS